MPGAERIGIIVTTILGVVGAMLGGFLATALGFGDPIDEFFDIFDVIAAIVGALIILFVWNATATGDVRPRNDCPGPRCCAPISRNLISFSTHCITVVTGARGDCRHGVGRFSTPTSLPDHRRARPETS